MIEIRDLTFQYPSQRQPVLQNVQLTVNPCTLSLVAGPSGSGKSTLLRCLNGLVPHYSGGQISGRVSVFGSDPIRTGPADMSKLVSFVFQEPETQFVYDIVEDEIAFSLENQGTPRKLMVSRIDEVCEQLNLTSLRRHPIAHISGGEKQRVAIASALANQPKVLVLDEPTSQLDPAGAADLLQYLVVLKERLRLTILIAEHRLERLLPFTDQLIYLPGNGGILQGTPQEMLPLMDQVPPIVQIGKAMRLKPYPLSKDAFPVLHIKTEIIKAFPERTTVGPGLLKIETLSADLAGRSILEDINFSLAQGQVTVLMGPNGAGKTTLLRSIMGLSISQGRRWLMDREMNSMPLNEIISQIAYLPQNPADLLFADSVEEELRLTLTNHHLPVNSERIQQHLSRFGLADKAASYPRDLSVGERQRTALAAITVHDPPIILLDEPTRGLDYTNKLTLADLLSAWRCRGKSILVTTHDVEFAAQLADRVVLLENGRVRYQGDPGPAFTQFPNFRTQTAEIFPATGWYRPHDVVIGSISSI